MRRRELSGGLAVGLLSLELTACVTASAASPLKALKANDFRNAARRGVGASTLRNGARTMADLRAISEMGADHVRIFIEPLRRPDGDAYMLPAQQWSALFQTLADLERLGLYVVLTAGFGPDARDQLWRQPRLQDGAVALWRDLAERLQGRAVVAGFDIVNEPVPPGLTYGLRLDRWLAFATRVVEAVRSADPQRVVVIESAPDATPESFSNLRPLPFDNLVYSLHSYHPFAFTHQGVMTEYPQARRYPESAADGRTTADVLAESLLPAKRFAERHGVPIYVGEFSATRMAPEGSAARYLADSMALFLQHGWSWSYHEFRAWHAWDVEIASADPAARQRSADSAALLALRRGLVAGREPSTGR